MTTKRCLPLIAMSFALLLAACQSRSLVATEADMRGYVEEFFRHNFRDITSRRTLEWGNTEKDADGNFSIRYKYAATVLAKDKMVANQVFTFSPGGKYIRHRDVEGFPKKTSTIE